MLKRVQGDEAREDPSRFSPPGARCAAVHRFANPARFLKLARPLTPACILAGLLLAAIGIYGGLFLTPPDYLQGESVRIIYVHVPRSEEHTSELQSLMRISYAVFCLKKKKKNITTADSDNSEH